MSRRRNETLVAYVHNVSPKKKSKCFNVRIQTAESANRTVKAICFDLDKRDKLVNAQISGDAVKLNNVIRQDETRSNYYAQYVITKNTNVEQVEEPNPVFERMEPVIQHVPSLDMSTQEVGSLVSVKATVDLSHSVEKSVKVGLRYARVVNQAYLINDTGSLEFAIWDEWVSYFSAQINEGNTYFNLVNLLVREFNDEKYVSTCSDTECYAITDEVPPPVDAPNHEVNSFVIKEFQSIHGIEYGYVCGNCQKLIKIKSNPTQIVTCDNCSVVARSAALHESVEVVIKVEDHGDQLFQVNVAELSAFVGDVSFSTDKAELTQKLMSIKDITVTVDKDNRICLA